MDRRTWLRLGKNLNLPGGNEEFFSHGKCRDRDSNRTHLEYRQKVLSFEPTGTASEVSKNPKNLLFQTAAILFVNP